MKKRVYTKKYFFDPEGQDYVNIKWDQGFFNFYIYHNQEKVATYQGADEMLKGVTIDFPNAGNVFIRMLTKPLGFEVKTGNRYLFHSRILAEEKLKTVSIIFYFVGLISMILGSFAFFIDMYSWWDALLFIPFFMGVYYVLTGYFVRKGIIWMYYVGVAFFTFTTLLLLLSTGLGGIVVHVLRIIFLVLLFSHLKYILDLHRHRKALNFYNNRSKLTEEIIDDLS